MPRGVNPIDEARLQGRLWTPALLPSLRAWYDPSDAASVTLVSNAIDQISDKSGNGNHWIAPTSPQRPAYSATINGLRAIAATGSQVLATTASFNFSQHFMMGVFRAPGQADLIGSNGVNTGHAFSMLTFVGRHRAHFWGASGVTSVDSAATVAANQVVVAGQSHGTATSLQNFQNGVVATAAARTATTQIFPFDRGRRNQAGSRVIGEVVFATREFTTDERQRLEGYLAHKWGTLILMPPTHPYRNTPPLIGG